MAVSTRIIRLQWENNKEFKADTKLGDGDWITIIEMTENNHMSAVWDDHVTGIVTKFMASKMAEIGNEMKA